MSLKRNNTILEPYLIFVHDREFNLKIKTSVENGMLEYDMVEICAYKNLGYLGSIPYIRKESAKEKIIRILLNEYDFIIPALKEVHNIKSIYRVEIDGKRYMIDDSKFKI